MITRKIILAALISVVAGVSAQQAAAQPGNIPVGKIAVISSDAFRDPKQGIAKVMVMQNQLDSEFKKPYEELEAAKTQALALQDEISKLQASAAADPKVIQAKINQFDQLSK